MEVKEVEASLPPEPEIDWENLTKKNVKKKKVKMEAAKREEEDHKEASGYSEIMEYFNQR